ncbi:MAG TPA: hypothetical protein VEZ91_10015 [Kurthia gibsonii]|nr:hypothetical protein [Kurthia gibsonii]
MKLQITKAYLDLVNPKLPESDPLKYRHNKFQVPLYIPNIIDTLVYSWIGNFKRCVPQDELKDYVIDSIGLTLSSGVKVCYLYDEVNLSMGFEGNLTNEELEDMKSLGFELTKKLMSVGMIKHK